VLAAQLLQLLAAQRELLGARCALPHRGLRGQAELLRLLPRLLQLEPRL